MSKAAPVPIYAVDTNVLMDWQARYYPTDIFKSLVPRIDSLVSQGKFFAPELVKEELGVVGPAELSG